MSKFKAFTFAAIAAVATFFGMKAGGAPADPLVITSTLLPLGTSGEPYSMPLLAVGGKTPYRWSAAGLPFGLTVSGGSIAGMLTQQFEGDVVVTVRDKTNKTVSVTLKLAVCKPVHILNPPEHPIETGKSYQFYAEGGAESVNPPKCNPPQTNPA